MEIDRMQAWGWSKAAFCVMLIAAAPNVAMSDEGLRSDACSRHFGRPGYCYVSLLSVAGAPGVYDSRKLQVVGYLALDDRVLVLYPNREAFVMGDRFSSVELWASYEVLRTAARRWAYSYVIANGEFRAGDSAETAGGRLGVLEEAAIVAPMTPRVEDRENLDPVMRLEAEGEDGEGRN